MSAKAHPLGSGSRRAWNPFSRHPLSRPKATLAATISAILVVAAFSEAVHDAWVAQAWMPAEAIIVGEPRRGPPEQRRGETYDPVLRVVLADGRVVTGRSSKPLFAEYIPPQPPSWTARRIPPRAGDTLLVYLDPAWHERMLPAREMTHRKVLVIPVNLLMLCIFGRLFYAVFRGEPPRLGM